MADKSRAVQVATVTQDYLRGLAREEMVSETLDRLDAASSCRPDIVCLPELFTDSDPESVPGPMTERLALWAKAKSAYVICPIKTEVDGRSYNSAVLIDRAGKVTGKYDKIHPTEGEMETGTCPGDLNAQVFHTDFGAIGIQICFDVNWHEVWAGLKQKGAEIVFWPSAYPAHRMLSALAWMNEYYVISSTMTRGSRIYDITGEVMAQSGMFQPWAQATLHLGKRLFEIDYHMDKIRKVEQKYGRRVLVQFYHDEDWFALTSIDPELSTDDVIAEFEMVPIRPYHARCERAIEKARVSASATNCSPAQGE
jgi:predicted amidohydrolase